MGGLLIALIVFTPEAMSALRAALDNQLQRAVSLCLGVSASTSEFTVLAILGVGLPTGQTMVLGSMGLGQRFLHDVGAQHTYLLRGPHDRS